MKGIQKVRVRNSKLDYQFELKRNITIVKGNSGTGKTTLYALIAEYTRQGTKSGVKIESSKPCVALVDMDWENQLKKTKDSIVFIDEGLEDISTQVFASAVKNSDNYYVFFTRENLFQLPYSVNEIYEIKTKGKGKKHIFSPLYKASKYYEYGKAGERTKNGLKKPDVLLTEDAKSACQFYEQYYQNSDVAVRSAQSNSNISNKLEEVKKKKVLIVADGAAFGAYIDVLMKRRDLNPEKISICLPESFEWMILKSGVIHDEALPEILQNPENYIESKRYQSWEQYFTGLLQKITAGSEAKYTKSKISGYYTNDANSKAIMAVIGL